MSSCKHIGVLYTKDPLLPAISMDLIRWHALSRSLAALGVSVDMITVSGKTSKAISPRLRVVPLAKAKWESYDAVKACYQQSIDFVPEHRLIAVRLARVAGEGSTSRDRCHIGELLTCQERIAKRANIVIVNDEANRERWIRFYGTGQRVHLLPTGCPASIPKPGPSPYQYSKPVAVFMGSLSNRRMIVMLGKIGRRLREAGWRMVVVGKNKTPYHCKRRYDLDKRFCKVIPPVPEDASWNYLFHARVGVALAPGPLVFENETSKLYSYLRTGLPIVCEERISNIDLIFELGQGKSFPYGDDAAAAKAIISLGAVGGGHEANSAKIGEFIKKHSWEERAKKLQTILGGPLSHGRSLNKR